MSTETDAYCTAVENAVEALRLAINDPADQIRLLSDLASFRLPAPPDHLSYLVVGVCRRASLGALARATADWQPTSSTETNAVIVNIGPIFDGEIRRAADMGDTATYQSLRALRAAVIADLSLRGSQLPDIAQISRNAVLPALVLAWQLYGDASRNVELTARNPTVQHPLFFGLKFEALTA